MNAARRGQIAAVALNAAIDKTYFVDRLRIGEVHRVPAMLAQPGGKGINVAKVAAELGESVTVSGFLGGYNGRWIESALAEKGIPSRVVNVREESRLCLNILCKESGTSTELLEPGPEITAAQADEYLALFAELARQSKVVALSGSLPRGLAPDYYARLVKLAKAAGAAVIVDTSGRALEEAIAAVPDVLKPNLQELQQLTGRAYPTVESVYEEVKRLMENGIRAVLVTLGADGAVAGIDGKMYRVEPVPVEAVNPVGCGDAFVAGVAAGLVRELEPRELLALAAACATANAMNLGAGEVRREQVDSLLPRVVVKEIVSGLSSPHVAPN